MPPDRILVTGASHGGIGGAVCRRLVAAAIDADLRPRITISATGASPGLGELAGELGDAGADVLTVTGDLSDPEFPAILAGKAAGFCGGLDLVVSCAGQSQRGPLGEAGTGDWDAAFAVHARAPWLLAKAACSWLKDSRGSFTAVGSVSGTVPHAGAGAYPAAKAALIMACRTLALEWAGAGVRVNVVSPGLISTGRKPKPYAAGCVPLGRAGTPEDVADAVAFLADAPYITGENIIIDGGLIQAGLELIRRA
jgi:NAD(P)-dependent dehydrogenase (short-subunit alcohol dehydrogenase family)